MSLLDSMSKPRWQHAKAEVRLAAVEELDDNEILLEILRKDEDPAVRSRALARIDDAALLDRLIDDPPAGLGDELPRQVRAQRLRQLLGAEGSVPNDADEATMLRIARLTDDESIVEAVLARLADPQLRMELALEHPVARVRLTAARSIRDIEPLQSLLQQAKHRDKAVFRYCRERVDEYLAAQRAEEELKENLAQLAVDAAELRAASDSPDYRPRFLQLQRRWAEIREQAAPEGREPIQADLDACEKRVRAREAEQATEQQEHAQTEKARQAFVDLLNELDGLDPAALSSTESATELESKLNGIEERWVAALRHARPDADQNKACKAQLKRWREPLLSLRSLDSRSNELERFGKAASTVDAADFKAVQKLQRQAGKLARALDWPEDFEPGMPAPIRLLREQQQQLEQQLQKLQKKERKALEKVEKAFEAFRTELATNHFRNADRALHRLKNLLRHLSPERQDSFQHELRPLLVRLQEIHDWQGFAIEPKKQELIGQMQALVGSGEDADTLAARIKALQDEWKALGPLSPRRDQELWKAFRAAADEAWAPCKEVFGQRAEARKQFYRQRMELVGQLREYEAKIAWPDLESPDPDLPAPDWKMVRKTLTTARKAFAELAPVDRKQERKSRKALDKVCTRIYGHLEKEYDRNIERKKALIAEAKALVEMDDLRQAIDSAKAIQRQWKGVGLTPQRADRPLWKEFRKTCDAIFARLGEERDQRHAERRARVEQRQAADKARAEKAAARKRQVQEQWQRLLDRMQACAVKEDDAEKAASLWGEDGDLPKGIAAEALEAWWNGAPPAPDEDACRTACIAIEVLAGMDSPPEDKQARMAYQMQRLVEGMGSGSEDRSEGLLDQVNQVLALRPPAQWLERFSRGVQSVRAKTR
jgi:negative regulator of replication initiation